MESGADSLAVLVFVTAAGLYIWAIVVCFQKGKSVFASLGIAGVLLPILDWFPIVGAIRMAKPSSSWARKHYGPSKMALAMQRFPEDAASLPSSPVSPRAVTAPEQPPRGTVPADQMTSHQTPRNEPQAGSLPPQAATLKQALAQSPHLVQTSGPNRSRRWVPITLGLVGLFLIGMAGWLADQAIRTYEYSAVIDAMDYGENEAVWDSYGDLIVCGLPAETIWVSELPPAKAEAVLAWGKQVRSQTARTRSHVEEILDRLLAVQIMPWHSGMIETRGSAIAHYEAWAAALAGEHAALLGLDTAQDDGEIENTFESWLGATDEASAAIRSTYYEGASVFRRNDPMLGSFEDEVDAIFDPSEDIAECVDAEAPSA